MLEISPIPCGEAEVVDLRNAGDLAIFPGNWPTERFSFAVDLAIGQSGFAIELQNVTRKVFA